MLKPMVARVDFRFDIVGRAPLEVVQEIFRLLPLWQTFEVQRVSRTWEFALSSPETIDMLLRPWFLNNDSFLQIPKCLSPRAISFLKAEYVEAYSSGMPFSILNKRRPTITVLDQNILTYADGLIAWVPGDGTRCKIYRIKSGAEKTWSPDGTGVVSHIALSSKMVSVITSHRRCLSWKLPMMRKVLRPFQVGTAEVETLVVSGSTLAVLYRPLTGAKEVPISVWSVETDGVHFQAEIRQWPLKGKILLDEASESVVLFERTTGDTEVFSFIRYDLAGVVLTKGFLERPHDPLQNKTFELRPANVDGSAIIWSFADKYKGMTRVIFELGTNKLLIKKSKLDTNITIKYEKPGQVFFFKEVMYYKSDWGRWCAADMERLSYELAVPTVPRTYEYNGTDSNGLPTWLASGDRTFLVHFYFEGFCVWCFDKYVSMTGEDEKYKKQRDCKVDQIIEDRIEERQNLIEAAKKAGSGKIN